MIAKSALRHSSNNNILLTSYRGNMQDLQDGYQYFSQNEKFLTYVLAKVDTSAAIFAAILDFRNVDKDMKVWNSSERGA